MLTLGNKIKLSFFIGNRGESDSRYTIFRAESNKILYGERWKFSISFHRKFLYLRKYYNEFRFTLLGLNIHFRKY